MESFGNPFIKIRKSYNRFMGILSLSKYYLYIEATLGFVEAPRQVYSRFMGIPSLSKYYLYLEATLGFVEAPRQVYSRYTFLYIDIPFNSEKIMEC